MDEEKHAFNTPASAVQAARAPALFEVEGAGRPVRRATLAPLREQQMA